MIERETRVIDVPERLLQVFEGKARYRCAYGGRGSGKTRTFATFFILKALECINSGVSGTFLCAREHMTSIKNSSKKELEGVIEDLGCGSLFKIGLSSIRSIPRSESDGEIEIVFSGLRHNISNIKSMSNILYCWVDEAEDISESSWRSLFPTIRGEGSEIWVTWNPCYEGSATDKIFRQDLEEFRFELSKEEVGSPKYIDLNSILSAYRVVEINYRDNPWFPSVLEEERKRDERTLETEHYAHIWEGKYISHYRGSYYSKHISRARDEGRICNVEYEPSLSVYTFWDLGGTGRNSDATSIWLVQFIGDRINVLEYIEGQGQSADYYINELRRRDLGYITNILPHDGVSMDRVTPISYEGILRKAGYGVEVVPNQGRGAVQQRIDAVRYIFHRCWFDEFRTKSGLLALNSYHSKWNEHLKTYVGANHDWSSHASDAFGLMAVWYGNRSTIQSGYLNKLSEKANRRY